MMMAVSERQRGKRMTDREVALIVGAGAGLSASLARLFARDGMAVAVAARDSGKLAGLVAETDAKAYACDASRPDDVAALFVAVRGDFGAPDLVVYNPSFRARGPIVELDPEAVRKVLEVTAFGAFLVAQQAAKLMLPRGSGSILFTGASAGVKGYANSSSFAMGKFALRGLANALARELHPQGIHIGHFVIDGGIRKDGSDPRAAERGDDGMLDPDAIAETYLQFHRQHRSAWGWEIELRPWVEKF
jgi:NAD(P)-dependent dehydrogenase (short-subunit alcohol dehydrogenase family)